MTKGTEVGVTTVDFELESISPLLMDRWTDLPQPKNEKGWQEQAKEKCYRDKDGNLCIPAVAVQAAMRLASSEVGKKMEGKKNRQSISAQVFVGPDTLSLGKKDYDEMSRFIAVRGKGDKVTRVAVYRPMIKEWTAKGTIKIFGDNIPHEFIKECLSLAGFRYGLLSYRPNYGRFQVTKFEVKENGK